MVSTLGSPACSFVNNLSFVYITELENVYDTPYHWEMHDMVKWETYDNIKHACKYFLDIHEQI